MASKEFDGIDLTVQAFLIEEPDNPVGFVGNRTECALLMMLRKWNIAYKEVRHDNETKVGCLLPPSCFVCNQLRWKFAINPSAITL